MKINKLLLNFCNNLQQEVVSRTVLQGKNMPVEFRTPDGFSEEYPHPDYGTSNDIIYKVGIVLDSILGVDESKFHIGTELGSLRRKVIIAAAVFVDDVNKIVELISGKPIDSQDLSKGFHKHVLNYDTTRRRPLEVVMTSKRDGGSRQGTLRAM